MKEKYPHLFTALRGGCIALAFIILSALTTFIIKAATVSAGSYFREWENYLIYIFCTASSVLIFNSFALTFAYSDKAQFDLFLKRENKEVSFFSEMKYIFSSALLRTEILTSLIIISLAAALGAFPQIGGMFPEPYTMSAGGWFPVVTLVPVCLILSILSKYEAARFYYKLYIEGDREKLSTPVFFIIRLSLVIFLYPIALPLAPALIYAIVSLFAIFAEISAILSVIGTIFAIMLLIFIIWGIKVLRGISKRKKFLKRIAATAKEKGYILSDLKNPYRSFATSKNQCSFSLELDGKCFDCIVISTLWKLVPLVFTSPTNAHFLHKFGTKDHGFEIKHTIDFYHTDIGEKIIIVDPSPKKVFVSENNKTKRLYSADRIWKTAFHDSDSFIGCMDRKCLDR